MNSCLQLFNLLRVPIAQLESAFRVFSSYLRDLVRVLHFHLRNRVRQQFDLVLVQRHVFAVVVFYHDDVCIGIFIRVSRSRLHQHIDVVSHFFVGRIRDLVKLGRAQIFRRFPISNISISQSDFCHARH